MTVIAIAIVAAVLWRHVLAIDWTEVLRSVAGYSPYTVATALVLSAISYLAYSCIDPLGKQYLRLPVSSAQCMSTAFVAYAFNQSLGAMIGTVAFRFRLYLRLGVSAAQISKQVVFSVLTNWFGFAALSGALFLAGIPPLPSEWPMGQSALRWLGALFSAIAIAYLLTCFLRRRPVQLFNRKLEPPSPRIALLQLACSLGHWCATAAILFVLLHEQIEYVTVLGALLLSSTATVVMRVPAGLGILEALFVALLRHRMSVSDILAAVFVLRAVFNLLPLAVAATIYLTKEFTAGQRELQNATVRRRAVTTR